MLPSLLYLDYWLHKNITELHLFFGLQYADTALMAAVKGGHVDAVEMLIEEGQANITVQNTVSPQSVYSPSLCYVASHSEWRYRFNGGHDVED